MGPLIEEDGCIDGDILLNPDMLDGMKQIMQTNSNIIFDSAEDFIVFCDNII